MILIICLTLNFDNMRMNFQLTEIKIGWEQTLRG